MDEAQVQKGQQWLSKLMQLMDINAPVNVSKIEVDSEENTSCWLTIDQTPLTPEKVELLIGDQGETIDAIQYLANALLHIGQDKEKSGYFMIDIRDYRGQRQVELQALAEQVAEKVRQTGQEEEITSLSSVERRQIHSILSQSQDLETESRGNEPDRRLIVRPR